MARWSFTQVTKARAAVGDVWPLVGEARRWREWSFLTRSGLERAGMPVPDGQGAVRRFTCLGIGSSEEVVIWDPPSHLAYTIVRGFPVRAYRADVWLTPDESSRDPGSSTHAPTGGTTITWSVTFDARFRGTGPALWVVLRLLILLFASSVARYAESLPPGAPVREPG